MTDIVVIFENHAIRYTLDSTLDSAINWALDQLEEMHPDSNGYHVEIDD